MTQLDEAFLDRFHRLGARIAKGEQYGAAPARKLALLIRPTIVARPGKTLVWCDWSNIEARVLPWLANSRGAEKVLDIFRRNDADPKAPDIYMVEAANTYSTTAADIRARYDAKDPMAEEQRQIGKVQVLSMGFGGGVGAFTAMATNYGVYVDPVRAQELVDLWRAGNPWARHFWGVHNRNDSYGLWGALCSAMEEPDTIHAAGRVAYVYDRNYHGGTVFCALPSGRIITYPRIKWERKEVVDRKTKQLVERDQLTFRKGYGRSVLWYGKLAENITQGEAASILRGTLRKLEYEVLDFNGFRACDWMPTVAHTHDEIVTEPEEHDAASAKAFLHDVMVEGFDWSGGLPLAAEASSHWYYTKRKLK